MTRRERWGVLAAILRSLDEHLRDSGENARVTRVAISANVPYDRLVAYLKELAQAGLVTEERMPRLTEKGKQFLVHYRQWAEVLSRFGLT